MPRPRFYKLPPDQQQLILNLALTEFASFGFNGASFNRIIASAGISKGSMYYYFDGKEDLYSHVVQLELGRLLTEAGPFPVPETDNADAFWNLLRDYYLRLMKTLMRSPHLAALARDWVSAASNPQIRRAQQEMEQAVLPWLLHAISVGQQARAVRTDVPVELLIAVLFGMGQAMDNWLFSQKVVEHAAPKLVGQLLGMIRGALSPPSLVTHGARSRRSK